MRKNGGRQAPPAIAGPSPRKRGRRHDHGRGSRSRRDYPRVRGEDLIRLFAGEDRKVGGFAVFRLYGGRQWSGSTVFPPMGRDEYLLRYLDDQRRKALDAAGAAALLYREP